MIGEGDDGHAKLLTAFVNSGGVIVRFFAQLAEARGGVHAGADGMDVQVASHAS
jgi:hypothetical protein